MTPKMRAKHVMRILNHYFPDPKVPLVHSDCYTLLIAVLLSAQCTDARVNQITPQLFSEARTPQAMIQLPIATIASIIRPCGLFNAKAHAIWHLSKMLIEKHNGQVPDNFLDLEALPGVGHKTASVVMAQGFGKAAFPVDTHIFRCARRWGLSHGKTVEKVEADLKHLFPQEHWNRLHLQIIYFARTFCPAKQHNPLICPLCSILSSA